MAYMARFVFRILFSWLAKVCLLCVRTSFSSIIVFQGIFSAVGVGCAPPLGSFGRVLIDKELTGTIPSQISTLIKLEVLYVQQLNLLSECWSHICWVVIMCTLRWFWCYFRQLGQNQLTGTIPPQVSLLTALTIWYAPHNQFCWVLGALIMSVGHCASLWYVQQNTFPGLKAVISSMALYRSWSPLWSSWKSCESTLVFH